ncbi:rod shape-determining protein MreC [Nocardioides jishulii]|uniref:Cell shape-determining protein MreC n=1 Tax=Nocardioides jishulii TaxID=2575440 RepID=A0A4U2YLM3_9ACTN|nr:rod shape-determining protein MreC [Nocardioides jishulii]QCX26929.1 rod shape-determining protein MreC [Nocardioides jishulii]TKI61412.1 rod shape-determining protein MreC [Nocardioides jishulii]
MGLRLPEKRWRGLDDRQPPRSTLIALVLASITLMVLDQQTGDSSPVEPVRAVASEVFAPVEAVTSTAVRPFTAVPTWFRTKSSLREQVEHLEAENAALREEVASSDLDVATLAEFEGLTTAAADLGRALVPARVIGYGPAQSFSRTVTIDAGTSAGIRPDMTVVNDDGLVGRVLRATRRTATVLLILDPESVVGGRIGQSKEIGFLKGRGVLGSQGRLDLELLDQSLVPAQGDTVLSWGSDGVGPYIPGVPVGTVTDVFESVREQSRRAVIEPFVDFTALDVVGVVVPPNTSSDRALVRVDGSIG